MILFLYNVALLVGLVVSAPWWLLRMLTTQKYREGLLERLGRVRPLRGAQGRPVIWVHAVSVGEVLAVSRLVRELDGALPQFEVVISTTTRTGQRLARERFGSDRVFYSPLDLPWAVRAYLHARRPALLVLVETEFWPNLLAGCFRREIPVVVVNARISDRSWPRYGRLRGLWRPFLKPLTAVLAQTEVDAGRLRALGCEAERVAVGGNLKFDVRAGEEEAITRVLRRMAEGRRFLVAGSTLAGEESALLALWPTLLAAHRRSPRYSGLNLVLAPRHPERFDAVAQLLEESGMAWRRRSGMETVSGADAAAPLADGEIVLLDSIGELASVYALASVAFVGGSLVAAGGHNPLEPAQFGVPVVMGPHYANFRGIVETLLAVDGLVVVEPAELGAMLAGLLGDAEAATRIGERGREVFEREAGATGRTVETLQRILARDPGMRRVV